jgi:hypothetical protein
VSAPVRTISGLLLGLALLANILAHSGALVASLATR